MRSHLEPRTAGLRAKLGRLLGYEHVVLFGRARAAMVAAIEETTRAGAPVVIPSNACSALLAAVIAAGRAPVLAPISAETGLVPDTELAALIDGWTGEPGLVFVTHLYGMLSSYEKSAAAARAHGWELFENDSLATRVFLPAAPRLGHGTIVSFGQGKTLDGGGGGALLSDDAPLAARLAERVSDWPVFDRAAEAVEDHVVLAQRHLAALGASSAGEALLTIEAAQCRHAFDERWHDRLDHAIAAFPDANDRRLRRMAWWRAALEPVAAALRIPDVPVGAAWRAVFKTGDGVLRERLVTALRAAGFDAGTNYPPLWDKAPNLLGRQRVAAGDEWGATVLTLWLTDAYDEARIRAGAAVIVRTIEESAGTWRQ